MARDTVTVPRAIHSLEHLLKFMPDKDFRCSREDAKELLAYIRASMMLDCPGADTKSDGGVEVTDTQKPEIGSVEFRGKKSLEALPGSCASTADATALRSSAGVVPGPSDAQLTKTPSADHDAGNLRSALKNLIAYVERNECTHEETHRGGAIWTICDCCGRKWADDRGGFVPYVEPVELTNARSAIEYLERGSSAPDNVSNLSGVSSAPNHQPHAVSQGWRDDMENAPRDGTRILLYTEELTPPTIQAQWRTYDAFYERAGEWVDVWNNDPIETNSGPIRPTHWLKIAPPSPAKTGGAS